jgi:aspartate racemase
MKHIGIIAHSAEGATLCYRACCLEAARRLGPHLYPEMTMTGVAMAPALEDYDRDLGLVRAVFQRDAAKLAAVGADFFILPDNTAHIALETDGPDLALPGLHIGDVVADAAARRGFCKLALLGTNWTMTGPVYPAALSRRGIEWAIPTAEDRNLIHGVILEELCLGLVREPSRGAFLSILDKLASVGCDGAALVCTEIPLLVRPADSPLPILDSTRLLASAAVDVALGEKKFPAWMGGPL